MSVDTHAKLKGKVSFEDIRDVVEKLYGQYGPVTIANRSTSDWDESSSIQARYDDSGRWRTDMCYIVFHASPDEVRDMFCLYCNVNFYENLSYYEEFNLEDMVKAETTFLSLGKWGHSVEIIKAIAEHFGGWVDENDCDDIPYYWVKKVE